MCCSCATTWTIIIFGHFRAAVRRYDENIVGNVLLLLLLFVCTLSTVPVKVCVCVEGRGGGWTSVCGKGGGVIRASARLNIEIIIALQGVWMFVFLLLFGWGGGVV